MLLTCICDFRVIYTSSSSSSANFSVNFMSGQCVINAMANVRHVWHLWSSKSLKFCVFFWATCIKYIEPPRRYNIKTLHGMLGVQLLFDEHNNNNNNEPEKRCVYTYTSASAGVLRGSQSFACPVYSTDFQGLIYYIRRRTKRNVIYIWDKHIWCYKG